MADNELLSARADAVVGNVCTWLALAAAAVNSRAQQVRLPRAPTGHPLAGRAGHHDATAPARLGPKKARELLIALRVASTAALSLTLNNL